MSRRRLEAIAADRDPEILARNVRRAREGLGLNRGDFCRKARLSPQTLARVEAGGGCTPAVERKIADAIGTVVGRLWERQELPQAVRHTPEGDRWYFAGHADGERFHRAHRQAEGDEPIRYDPDAIQDPAERARMGRAGLAVGFVRVTTSHLRAGSVISSLIELYGRIESAVPPGHLLHFLGVRGASRVTMGESVFALREGDVVVAEAVAPIILEPEPAAPPPALPPLVAYVDPQARLNRPASPS